MSADQVFALSSAFVAVLALGVSVWQGVQARKHNRSSVRPHLTYYTYFHTLKPYAGVELSNNGIGPAVIDSFTLFVDGEPVTDRRDGGWRAVLRRLAGSTFDPVNAATAGAGSEQQRIPWIYNWLDTDDAIRVGESVLLLGIDSKAFDERAEQALRDVMSHVRIRIEHRTVYGERLATVIPEHTRGHDL